MKDLYNKEIKLENKKLYLFDMDGTIYLGNKLFDGMNELLNKIRERGNKFVFITNNSSKSVKDYIKKLNRLGIKNVTKDDFFTSCQASILFLSREYKDPKIYAQGTKSFIKELRKYFKVYTKDTDDADLILLGFDPEINGKKVISTSKMVLKDIPYYATNPDWNCPTEFGSVPDCGSMCFGYEKVSGRKPKFIGKPEPLMIEEIMKKLGYNKDEVVVIGDRLYTDIASGVNANVDTICVLSGEVKKEEVDDSKLKPTYLLNIITEIIDIL